jgi:adenosine kinase
MRALLCGSIAFDNIMVFPGRFREHILPEQIHILNVAFLVPQMRREFGGCAGNIAYALKRLGDEPEIMATVGADADPYLERLSRLGIDAGKVKKLPDAFTAQAFITTDLDDNQITAFHPGAMDQSQQNHIGKGDSAGVSIGMLSPDGRQGMLQHAREFKEAGIPFVFDPGQGLPMFSGEELLAFIELADWACFNSYEMRLASERIGLPPEALAEKLEALIVTQGGEGAQIHAGGKVLHLPAAKASAIVDPTGCGDAYRGGLLYGLMRGWDWEKTGRLAAVMGALKIECQGPQGYAPSKDEIVRRHEESFGQPLAL